MLSRMLPSLRQCTRVNAARSFAHLTAQGKTESEILSDIKAIGNPDEFTAVKSTGDASFYLEPVEESQVDQAICDANALRFSSQEGDVSEDDQPILTALGLNTFERKATLFATFAVTALSREWYVLNEETFVMGCLAAGFTTMYALGREGALSWYKESQEGMLSDQQNAENRHMAACDTLINMSKKSESVTSEIEHVFNDKVELLNVEAQASAVAERNRVVNEYTKKLQNLVNQKADEENKAFKEFLAQTSASVRKQIDTKAFKTKAIKYAIAALTNPGNAGTDPTAELFQKSIK